MKREIEKGVVHTAVSLQPFTSWHIGGAAEKFYWPSNLSDLSAFLATLPPDESLTWLGLGSNSLIADAGIPGTVILTQGVLKEMSLSEGLIRAEAGLSCAQVARFAAKNNQVGGEFLAGIPGTVGGALFMNAGAFGGEIWDCVVKVETLTRDGILKLKDASAFEWGYRFSRGLAPDEAFVAAYFAFRPGDGKAGLETIKALLQKRSDTQPTGEPSCGSTFRNPPGDYAARLIESVGLKGYRLGGMEVSPKHANFLINRNEATAADVLALVAFIQKTVRAKTGVDLVPEFRCLGNFASTNKDKNHEL